jgi:hypothetical protein
MAKRAVIRRRIAKWLAFVMPLCFAWGFFEGCEKGDDDQFLGDAMKVLSTARIESDSITIKFWHATPPVDICTCSYPLPHNAPTDVIYTLPEPYFTRIDSSTLETIATLFYGEVITNTEQQQRRIVVGFFPAFPATIIGYSLGVYAGTSLGLAENTAKINNFARNKTFREEMVDSVYYDMADRLSRFYKAYPGFKRSVQDDAIVNAFATTSEHSDTDRAGFHQTIIKYLAMPEFRNLPPPQALPTIELVKALAVFSFLLWACSVVYVLKTKK